MAAKPILLFHDFGSQGSYQGEMALAVYRIAPQAVVIPLQSDAPACDPRAAAYLLKALSARLPEACIVVAVVDPGVGSTRRALLLQVGERSWVGPDIGLWAPLARLPGARLFEMREPVAGDAATFHGRDLFAPVAARLARGLPQALAEIGVSSMVGADWPDQLGEIIYIDRFGNCFAGLDGCAVQQGARLLAGGRRLRFARTFSEVAAGEAFWYRNSSDLVEIAVNRGRADLVLGLGVGDPVRWSTDATDPA